MKLLSGFLLCLHSMVAYGQATQAENIQQVATLSDLMSQKGSSTLIVADARTGGIFDYTQRKLTADSGVVFPAHDKGYWVRRYDKSLPVKLSWFPANMDSTTNDARALKAALRYDAVTIDGVIALAGGTQLPAGKTIEFAPHSAIVLLDTVPVKFESYLKASDLQYIFMGTGKVRLGTRSAQHISACWFGAAADCMAMQRGKGTDNTRSIQNAIYAAEKVSDVYLPPSAGNFCYRITSTITITKRIHFFSFRFHGGGTSLGYTADDRATNIFADMAEGPAINIQGSRRVYITDLAIRGLNTAPARMGVWSAHLTSTDSVENPLNFLSPGLKMSYAAITTDAEKNSRIWSADIVFHDLQITGFGIGIGISQAGNLQGDRMRVDRCQINSCVYGLSIGNAQARSCHFKDVDMVRVWCGVTNKTFGDRSGSMFQVTGGQWCHLYKAFIIQPCYLGQCIISGLYTEALGSLGIIGDKNANTGSVLFRGCDIKMRDEALHTGKMYLPPFYAVWAYADLTFDGCNFYLMRHTLNMFAGSETGGLNGSSITLRGCTILKCDQVHIVGRSHVENTYFSPDPDLIDYNNTIAIEMDKDRRYTTGFNAETVVSGREMNTADNTLIANNLKVSRTIPRFYTVQDSRDLIDNISLSHDTLVFRYDTRLQPTLFRYVLPGDMLGSTIKGLEATGHDNPAFRVMAIDTVSRSVTAIAFSKKITFEKLALYTNSFFTTKPMYATVVAGNTNIQNVEHTSWLHPGDFITFTKASRAYRISNIDTQKNEIRSMTPVAENINDRVELYNQLLTPYADTSISNAAARIVTTDTYLRSSDHTVIVNSSEHDVHITLPAEVSAGHTFFIKKNIAVNRVIIAAEQCAIDGMKNITLKDNYQSVQLLFDGKGYLIIK